jgi:ATP-dependent RNA helicase RhlE
MTFTDLKITRQFVDALDSLGVNAPTEIQEKAIPMILAGQDVVGIAQTGTGKTIAYLLPLIQKLKFFKSEGPRVLILVPTKELVIQVAKVLNLITVNSDLKYTELYGGIGPKSQIESISNGLDIIVATPGRFLEVYSKGVIVSKTIKHVVLDECDRMMDMGFWPQLRQIQEKLPQKKQYLLFSATFPDKVKRIADNFLLFPNVIEISPPATPAITVSQFVYFVPNVPSKIELLLFLLRENQSLSRVMIFVRSKEMAVKIENVLIQSNIGHIRSIHSNKSQNSRINAMNDFRSGNVRVLIATDVAARGIDVIQVSHVINFQVPFQHDDYIHRIGRTGRAFHTGEAITFVDESERYHLRLIEKLMNHHIEVLKWPDNLIQQLTSKSERQDQNREIDRQKRKENPDFKGAFHEKKIKWAGKKKSR